MASFCFFIKIFSPVGVNIIKEKEQAKEKHKEIIKQINSKLGLNKDKINILKNNYSPISVRKYINTLIENTSYFEDKYFDLHYQTYRDIKHSNMITPGTSFEHNQFNTFAKHGVYLILGIMYYLKDFKF